MAHIPKFLALALIGVALEITWLGVWAVSETTRIGDVDFSRARLPQGVAGDLIGLVQRLSDKWPEFRDAPPLFSVVGLGVLLTVAGVGYLIGITVLHRGAARARHADVLVLAFAVLFQLTLLVMPGVFSTDVFSYLAYGELAGMYGLNPYVHAPVDLPSGQLVEFIFFGWRTLPSPYGPLWTTLSAALGAHLGHLDIAYQVIAHKLLMSAIQLANLGLLWVLLQRGALRTLDAAERVTAFAVVAWNPLILLELTANGHNDSLMLLFLLVGLIALAIQPAQPNNFRRMLAGVVLALSILVKYATVIVALVAAVAWARELPSRRARLVWLGGTGLLMLGLAIVIFQPWFVGMQTLSPAFDEVNGAQVFRSLPGWAERWFSNYLELNAPALTQLWGMDTARVTVKLIATLSFGLYAAYELRRIWNRPPGPMSLRDVCAVSARLLVVLLLFVQTEVHSWYLSWPLVLASLLGWRSRLCRLVAVLTVTSLPVDYMAVTDATGALPRSVHFTLGVAYITLPWLALVGSVNWPRVRSATQSARETAVSVIRAPTRLSFPTRSS